MKSAHFPAVYQSDKPFDFLAITTYVAIKSFFAVVLDRDAKASVFTDRELRAYKYNRHFLHLMSVDRLLRQRNFFYCIIPKRIASIKTADLERYT